ncbi:MAG: TonB-dependent receptor [Bacteroidetes bacterium]|nr:TonB-dependent receptor [Bacteroidota bacterium]
MKSKLIILTFFFSSIIFGQKFNISGRVVDVNNSPLLGVNVILSETSLGAATDTGGKFVIKNVPGGVYTLEISAVGFKKYIRNNLLVSSSTDLKIIVLAEEAVNTEQVIVTAGKYEQRIEDLPVSSVVLLPRMISRQNFTSVDQMLRYVPGVSMALDQLSIRGSSGYSKGAGTRVLVALDGVPLYTGDTGEIIWEMIPLTDIERIEIIKGPASSLYGSTAIGGVVNIITKTPSDVPINHVKTYFGIYGEPSYEEWKWSDVPRTYYGISYTHSHRINKLGYTFSVKKTRDNSYIENNFKTRIVGYTKLNYEFTENNSLAIVANYLYMDRGNFLYWKDSRNVLRPKDDDRDQTVESNRLFISAIYDHQLSGDLNLKNKTSYYRSKFTGKGIEITTSTSNLIRNELLFHFKVSDEFNFIAGSELSYAEVESNLFSAPNFFSAAGFFQGEYDGIKNVKVTIGLRYDFMKLDSLLGASAVTPKIGVNYRLSDNIILRSSVGTGFRAPSPAEVFTSQPVGAGIDIIENPDLEAETSLAFEVGAILKPTKSLTLDMAFFQTNYDNFIEPTLTTTGDIQFLNIVEAKIQGFDLSVNHEFTNLPINLNFGYTYLWARNNVMDRPMKYRPRHQLNAGVDYSPLPFDFGLRLRYWSRIEAIDDALVEPPIALIPDGDLFVSVYVVDLTIGYNFYFYDAPVKLYINAKNVFNYNYTEFIGNLAPIQNVSFSLEAFL